MINKKCMFKTQAGQNLIVHVKDTDKDTAPGMVMVRLYDSTTSEKREFELEKKTPEISRILESTAAGLDHGDIQALYLSLEPRMRALNSSLGLKVATAGTQGDSNLRSSEQAQMSYSAGNFGAAVRHAKESVARSREGLGAIEAASEGAAGFREAIGDAYKLMGDALRSTGDEMRAVSSYALSLKANPELDEVRFALQALLQSKTWVSSQDPYGLKDVEDIEDLLQRHTPLANAGQRMQFSCTQCGECCRTRDHIALSPLDVYSLSRADSMGQHQLVPTSRIYRHPVFSEALVFGRDAAGYPTCQLRPRRSPTGACRFSYPLFATTEGAGESSGSGSYPQAVLSVDEVGEYLSESEERNRLGVEYIDGGDAALQELWEECEDDFDKKYANVSPLMNAMGKQALGCMLGKADMPTLCASFPLAPETDYAGPAEAAASYQQELSDRLGTGMDNPPRGNPRSAALHAIKTDESFVLLRAFGCEGFADGDGRAGRDGVRADADDGHAVRDDDDGFRPVHNTASKKKQGDGTVVEEFLEGWGLRHKWAETRWFGVLRRDLAQYLPADGSAFRSKSMQSHYAACMQRIWYDFDGLAKERRPIRSYARLKTEIYSASWALARATKVFLRGLEAARAEGGGAPSEDAEEQYEDLVDRLDILY